MSYALLAQALLSHYLETTEVVGSNFEMFKWYFPLFLTPYLLHFIHVADIII